MAEHRRENNQPLCPCCSREMKGIHDYPQVFVVGFQRNELPEDLRLPIFVNEIFIDKSTEGRKGVVNKSVPKQAIEMFNETGKEIIQFHDWIWTRRKYGTSFSYQLCKEDGSKSIIDLLQRNLRKMEEMVGLEVPRNSLRIRQPRLGGYSLDFIEREHNNNSGTAELRLLSWGGGTIQSGTTLVIAGELTYEGRFLNH